VSGGPPDLGTLAPYSVGVRRVEKPWGYELVFALTDRYCGKIIFVRAGEQLSLQYHERKDETVYLHAGRIEMEIGEAGEELRAVEVVGPGASFRLAPGVVHRWRAVEDSLVLEVSTPELDDVVRLEDRYGRAGS
jgi:mannose-6-phosphate isomerase-like protein (cupin superfamily)